MPAPWSSRWKQLADDTYVRNTDQENDSGYESWTKAELVDELGLRGLSKIGNKGELVARLEADDAS